MYSLVSAAVLAQDVTRHPQATRLADVLDRILALTAADLADLTTSSEPAPEAVRRRVRTACDAPRRSGWTTQHTSAEPGQVDVLAGQLLGTLADLEALLQREEPLAGATATARQVALDAVVASWVGTAASLGDVSALSAPWDRCQPLVGPPLPETPRTPAVRALLEEIGRRTPEQWTRTTRAHQQHRGGMRWSQAMHEACVAAHDANRLHEVARAQLAGARSLALAHTGSAPSAVSMAVSAAVQAACTVDLLPGAVTETLISDWEAGS